MKPKKWLVGLLFAVMVVLFVLGMLVVDARATEYTTSSGWDATIKFDSFFGNGFNRFLNVPVCVIVRNQPEDVSVAGVQIELAEVDVDTKPVDPPSENPNDWTAPYAYNEWGTTYGLRIDAYNLVGDEGHKGTYVRFTGVDGKAISDPVLVKTHVDTSPPATAAVNNVSCQSGGKALFRYRVDDTVSPRAKATLVIRYPNGRLANTVWLGQVPTNKVLSKSIKLTLVKGKYNWKVCATDMARWHQQAQQAGKLVIR